MIEHRTCLNVGSLQSFLDLSVAMKAVLAVAKKDWMKVGGY